ncbi:MAG TPA: methylated-DNA--[protein]-cysteine S-methyltransferase [Vicinamibacterales bacterium]|nr:methylated-DNA--[protein]-cysteine S-methyltransferase [Vicinamibacterales bacterium]
MSGNGEQRRHASRILDARYEPGSPGGRQEGAMARTVRETQRRCSYKTMNSPVGRLTLAATDRGLAAILWENDHPDRVRLNIDAEDKRHPVLVEAERQLTEYFAGQRRAFSVRLDPAGTDFQRAVWNALLTIPFGETRSYAEIAQQIGKPAAVRAVGDANRRNPVSIIAPCHRVVGSSGALTGFAGGLDAKARLLALEGVDVEPSGSSLVSAARARDASAPRSSSSQRPRSRARSVRSRRSLA